jgi:1-deoxy-D-xylulose-5-phosphate synthase
MYALLDPSASFLESIVSPKDLKTLSVAQLEVLSAEIREEIVQNLNRTGGHLASNLGVVETTLALHYVFDSPKDKILWDVGHQAYVHKMLTGRREQFANLRQHKGLSGFINPLESDHDAFIAGHSSTSISLAVGMSLARDHFQQRHKVIALIGDGGLTGGMALEAINHLGHLQKDVLIILNDNEMSISENVGGFSQYMKRIKETFFYKDIKLKINQIEDLLERLPLSPDVRSKIDMVKAEAKGRFETPGIVFEKLGVNYSGPIDGHDVASIIQALRVIKTKATPQILHLVTQKGKGYGPAEKDSIKYHGISAHSLEPPLREKVEPTVIPKAKTYSDIFSEALIEIAAREPDMVAITPATAEGSSLVKFAKVYPNRFFDVAICEQHAVTMAAGMAKAGLKPVVSIYSTFLQRAMDQVIHDVAIMNLPVLFGIDRAGLVEDGETHQGVFDIAFLRSVPNFTVIAPKDTRELRNMIYTVINQAKGPVAIRFPRDKAVGSEVLTSAKLSKLEIIDYTKWEMINHDLDHGDYPGASRSQIMPKDERTDAAKVVLVAYGAMVEVAVQAKALLAGRNIDLAVVYARSVKPLDEAILSTVCDGRFAHVVTMEEGYLAGGFGSAILEWLTKQQWLAKSGKQPQISCLGIPDRFIEHGGRNILLANAGLTPEKVAEFVMALSL